MRKLVVLLQCYVLMIPKYIVIYNPIDMLINELSWNQYIGFPNICSSTATSGLLPAILISMAHVFNIFISIRIMFDVLSLLYHTSISPITE